MPLPAKAMPGAMLLPPDDHTLIMIDEQSQMAFTTKSTDAILLGSIAAVVAKAATSFDVSFVLTTVAEKAVSAPLSDEIGPAIPSAEITTVPL